MYGGLCPPTPPKWKPCLLPRLFFFAAPRTPRRRNERQKSTALFIWGLSPPYPYQIAPHCRLVAQPTMSLSRGEESSRRVRLRQSGRRLAPRRTRPLFSRGDVTPILQDCIRSLHSLGLGRLHRCVPLLRRDALRGAGLPDPHPRSPLAPLGSLPPPVSSLSDFVVYTAERQKRHPGVRRPQSYPFPSE